MRTYGCRGDPVPDEGPLAPVLGRSTTFRYRDAETLRAVGAGERAGEFYPRYSHAGARAAESAVADLEGADGAVAFASGMAALHAILFAFVRAGDSVAAARDLYGYTGALLDQDLPRLGVRVQRFDPWGPVALAEQTRVVLVETPTNPLCRVVDVARMADLARAAGALLAVDATFAPPPAQRVLDQGADLVMHSATKALGGHSDLMAGVVAGRHEQLEVLDLFRRRTGAVLAPDSAWLLLRSLQTLPLRLAAASENAARLAAFLEERVKRLLYPGFGSMLCFEVDGGLPGAAAVMDRFDVVARAVSLGGVETVASLPMHTSHAMLSPEARAAADITDGLIRLSVGIEPYETLQADLTQALG